MYEKLLEEAEQQRLYIYEKSMKTKGLQAENVIWINKHIPTNKEKTCILAEELGHYYTSAGNILDQSKLSNRKQEQRARNWAYEKLIPLSAIVQAYREGIRNRYELADFLDVTEDFLQATFDRYQEKHGDYVTYDGIKIAFNPLEVICIYK